MVEKLNEDGTAKIEDAFDARLGEEFDAEAAEAEAKAAYDNDGKLPVTTNTNTTEDHIDADDPVKKDAEKPTVYDEGGNKLESPEVEAEEEGEEEHEAEAEPEAKKPRPWSELRKTKKENKVLNDELQAEREARRKLEERFKVVEQRLAPIQPKNEQQVPEFTADPLANLDRRTGMTQQQIEQLNQQMMAMQLQNQINADEANFSQSHPDYTEARDWLLEQEMKDAQTMFKALPEQQRDIYARNLVDQRRSILIATARETGQSVAELAYEVAKSRGHAAKSAKPDAPIVAKKDDPSPEASRERVVRAKAKETQAQASLASVGSSPTPKSKLTRADIMAMSEKEMDALEAQNPNWSDEVEDE